MANTSERRRESELPAKAVEGGIALHIRLTPKGGADRVEGIATHGSENYLKVRVSAAPEGGKANAALIEAVATWLNVPRSSVTVTAGQKARQKTLRVDGKAEELLARVAALLSQGEGQ